MSSFFTLPGSAKRKRQDLNGSANKKVRPEKSRKNRDAPDDDEISSDEDDGKTARIDDDSSDDDELKAETAAEKRLRLAQHYLDNIRKEVGTRQSEAFLRVRF